MRIPFLGVAPGSGMTDVFVIVALFLGIAGSLVLVNLVWLTVAREKEVIAPWATRLLFVSALLVAGPGNLWIQLTLPTGYEEAILWASTFILWAFVALVQWLRTDRERWLVLAAMAFVLGANSRPSAVPVSIAAAALILVQLGVRREWGRRWRAVLVAIAMGIVPVGTAVGVWFAKLGVPIPPLALNYAVEHSARWANILRVNGGHDSWWGFIPTNVVQYLRPDALMWLNGDLVAIRPGHEGVTVFPPLEGLGVYVTPMASVTSLVPVSVLLIIVTLWRIPRLVTVTSGSLSRWMTLGLAASAWASFALLAINVGVQNRYMGDLAPAIALTGALGTATLSSSERIPRWLAHACVVTIGVLAVAGVAIEFLHQEWQIARYV